MTYQDAVDYLQNERFIYPKTYKSYINQLVKVGEHSYMDASCIVRNLKDNFGINKKVTRSNCSISLQSRLLVQRVYDKILNKSGAILHPYMAPQQKNDIKTREALSIVLLHEKWFTIEPRGINGFKNRCSRTTCKGKRCIHLNTYP